jgi:hypothetical protein
MKLHHFLLLVLFTNCSSNAQIATKSYDTLLAEINTQREVYAKAYSKGDSFQRDSIVTEARSYLIENLSDEIFPQWYGTQWYFNGTTQTPKKGKIACGYFVTTTLRDLGYKIPRIKWAQMASEPVIKKLTANTVHRFSNKSVQVVKSKLTALGDGVYLVGLDSHVGYIVVSKGKMRFVHANYYQSDIGVMSEKLETENPFNDSSYRVIGKLFSDEMVVSWLKGLEYS